MKTPSLASIGVSEPWPAHVVEQWTDLAHGASVIKDSIGQLHATEDHLAKVIQTAESEGVSGVFALVRENPKYLNALTILWSSGAGKADSEGAQLFRKTKDIVGKFLDIEYRPSELAVRNLYSVYAQLFDFFDRENPDELEKFRQVLAAYLTEHYSRGRLAQDVLLTKRQYLWDPNHVETLVQAVCSQGQSPQQFLDAYGISGLVFGRFNEVVQMRHLLEIIRSANAHSDVHEFLSAIEDNPVLALKDEDDLPFKFTVVRALIEQPIVTPSETWVFAVLRLAGDPRDSSPQPVWARIPEILREKFVSWLAVLDLKYFLEILQEYAKADATMARMFPERKRFIEGLSNQGLVQRTRLFLGTKALNALRPRLRESGLLAYVARIEHTHSTTAVVYMDLGNVHVVEGSHQWALRIFDELPSAQLLDPDKRTFRFEDLGPEMARKYRVRTGDQFFERSHTGDVWMGDVAAELSSRGVKLNAAAILDRPALGRYLSQGR